VNIDTVKMLLGIAGDMTKHIWDVIQRGDKEELRRLTDVWPQSIKTRISLLAAEEKARARVRDN